jgi:serine carboxypeptidase-like clade I
MVGNGVTDPIFDDDIHALFPFVHGMGLISDTMYEVIVSCKAGYYKVGNDICSQNFEKVGKVRYS